MVVVQAAFPGGERTFCILHVCLAGTHRATVSHCVSRVVEPFGFLAHRKLPPPVRLPYISCGVSLAAQLVKNMPAMHETPVQFLGRGDPLEKG